MTIDVYVTGKAIQKQSWYILLLLIPFSRVWWVPLTSLRGHFGYSTFFLRKARCRPSSWFRVKKSQSGCVRWFTSSIWTHSVPSRYPEQSFKFINSFPHWVVLYIAFYGYRAVNVSSAIFVLNSKITCWISLR